MVSTMDKARFVQLCLEKFRFLIDEFDFKLRSRQEDAWGYRAVFRNKTTGVKIDLDWRDGLILVVLYRLVEGKIKENPAVIVPDSELYSFSLGKLLSVRAPQRILPRKPLGQPWTDGLIQQILARQAQNLRDHGADVLSGNFRIFTKLEKLAKKEAAEYAAAAMLRRPSGSTG
jgi:hypothetical protein